MRCFTTGGRQAGKHCRLAELRRAHKARPLPLSANVRGFVPETLARRGWGRHVPPPQDPISITEGCLLLCYFVCC